MKIKKTFIIISFLLCLLMIGAVSAANNDTVVSSDVNGDTSAVLAQEDAKAVSSNDDTILKENYSETSFKALNKTINEATGSEIELDNDYTYDGSSDSEFKDGIIINKSLTINGNGKTINADGKAGIFKITSGAAVTIKNLNFINGYANNGGAINVDNSNLTITSSNLTQNKAGENGGAIYSNKGGTVIVDNSIFIDNDGGKRGGAIYNSGHLTVSNSLFENNIAIYDGGAIISYNNKFSITKSKFKGNKAGDLGGAVCNKYGTMFITECVFENNEIGDRGGALYANTVDDGISEQDKYQHVRYSNFTNNTAKGTYVSGGAIYFTGYLNGTGNIFTNNHGGTKETIDLGGFWAGIYENNTYISTDINIIGTTLSIKDNRNVFNDTEDIILTYNIKLKYPQYYKDIQTGLRGITLYVDGENRTTLYENITLSNLKPGPHTAYFTVLDQKSDNITFYVMGESQISTPETTYEYAEGENTKIPLEIIDKSDLTGTINITVKDQDSYKLISTHYNVRNGSKISTATLAEVLENIYGTLDASYTINITYISEYAYPSSTEFILNINKERNTNIIYDIINNTEGNLQINITVLDELTNTPIPDANIQITGDITLNTTSGKITDDTLTAGDHTITVQFPKTGNYKASQTTINFKIDKVKKTTELDVNVNADENNVTITATVDSTATGLVKFNVSGDVIYVDVNNGRAVYNLVLPAGDYNVEVTYIGDDNFNPNSTSSSFTVVGHVKQNTTIVPNVIVNNETATIEVTVNENATGFVTVTISGKTFIVPVESGKAVFSDEFKPGTYTANITYMGDNDFNANTITAIVNDTENYKYHET